MLHPRGMHLGHNVQNIRTNAEAASLTLLKSSSASTKSLCRVSLEGVHVAGSTSPRSKSPIQVLRQISQVSLCRAAHSETCHPAQIRQFGSAATVTLRLRSRWESNARCTEFASTFSARAFRTSSPLEDCLLTCALSQHCSTLNS